MVPGCTGLLESCFVIAGTDEPVVLLEILSLAPFRDGDPIPDCPNELWPYAKVKSGPELGQLTLKILEPDILRFSLRHRSESLKAFLAQFGLEVISGPTNTLFIANTERNIKLWLTRP